MKKAQLVITALVMLILVDSCSRKVTPGTENNANSKAAVAGKTKTVSVRKIKIPVPKVIVVNDSVASKTFDGKYYYDLDGHRYWRNNKDGKYYLYNKSMATDPDFRKP